MYDEAYSIYTCSVSVRRMAAGIRILSPDEYFII